MDGSKQDSGSGSGKDGKDSNPAKRRQSKWGPAMNRGQDQDGQPKRPRFGLPRQGGPTIAELQKRTPRTAGDGWGTSSSTQPAVAGDGWGTAPKAAQNGRGWGATTAPATDGGGWGAPQTPTGNGGGWGRGATENRQGLMSAGQVGASQQAEAQGGAFIGPPPPPPPGAPCMHRTANRTRRTCRRQQN